MTPTQLESVIPIDEALDKRPTLWHLFWGILTGATSMVKELDAAHKLITRLEQGELAQELCATRAIKKMEQLIIKLGDSPKSAKTIRHELLALLDKEYHQEVAGRDNE